MRTTPPFTLPETPVDQHEVEVHFSNGAIRPITHSRYRYHVRTPWKSLYAGGGTDFADEWQVFIDGRFTGRVDGWRGLVTSQGLDWSGAYATRREAVEADAKALRERIRVDRSALVEREHLFEKLLLELAQETAPDAPETEPETFGALCQAIEAIAADSHDAISSERDLALIERWLAHSYVAHAPRALAIAERLLATVRAAPRFLIYPVDKHQADCWLVDVVSTEHHLSDPTLVVVDLAQRRRHWYGAWAPIEHVPTAR